jgi:hypothetical protein
MADDEPTAGEIACQAWTASHKKHHGHNCNILNWDGMKPEDRADWEAAAAAAYEAGRDDATDYYARGGSFK